MRIAPMMRSIDLILLVALVAIVSWTFKIKHESHIVLEKVAELEQQIAAEKVEIDLLKSDWSLLTSPARLQELAERYKNELELEPMSATQMATQKDLPGFKISDPQEKSEGFAETDTSIKTGSIGRDAQ